MICVEINNGHCWAFLLSAWYRPPNSEIGLFDNIELFLSKSDLENKELILIGDINCDYMKVPLDPHSRRLQFLCSLYQLSQLIDQPTRITEISKKLIDLMLTKRPENTLSTGVIHFGISDHSLRYAVRKLPKSNPTIREVRDFKHFSADEFRADLLQVP